MVLHDWCTRYCYFFKEKSDLQSIPLPSHPEQRSKEQRKFLKHSETSTKLLRFSSDILEIINTAWSGEKGGRGAHLFNQVILRRTGWLGGFVGKKNWNATKPPEQSKGLGGNIGCHSRTKSFYQFSVLLQAFCFKWFWTSSNIGIIGLLLTSSQCVE